jgi:hypothetical protein
MVKIMDIIDRDIGNHVLLITYESIEFYKPKSIYLEQSNIFNNRQLYSDTSLASYIKEDPIFIKEQQLRNIDSIKQQLLYELEILKNG